MSDFSSSEQAGAIAIVGMAGRFPGAASVDELWRNLRAGKELIAHFSDDELRRAGVDLREVGEDYVKARAILDSPESFDAAFFGITAREAALIDPQQRLFLETCWEALEDAAIEPNRFPGLIGVWGGASSALMTSRTYLQHVLSRPGAVAAGDMLPLMLGNHNDFLTTRVSYKLNLRGPSVNVQTACSTSLVAVAHACQALLNWQCDVALAGGVCLSYPQATGYTYHEGGITSPDGHCRPFDAAAAGTVPGNAVAIVTLRRLEDAIADGHDIIAVIRGTATNNDGAGKVSFAAPSIEGQAEVIAMAHAAAGVSPSTIDFVEAHGTATPLGDPIEVAALTRAFRAGGATGVQTCLLGAIKSNFGHVDRAAGVAGLIKAALALRHREIPATLHFTVANPKCELETSPFKVNSELVPWPNRIHPRRAGVSSFGLGGTNAHVVLQEAPVSPVQRPAGRPSELVVLSARTQSALEAATDNLVAHLERHSDIKISDLAFTLSSGRQAFSHRRAVVASTVADAVTVLRGRDPKRMISGVSEFGSRTVAFMFSGGGTQYVQMGRELRSQAPVFREELDRALTICRPTRDLESVLFPSSGLEEDAAKRLEEPSWGLPALFAIQYALARQFMAWGVQPDALIGHSMGEYTAACLSGVMSLEVAMAVVAMRGKLFETLPRGGMIGVPLSESAVRNLLDERLAIAAVNADDSCVVSGPPAALADLERRLAEDDVECRRLHINVAAHSQMVEPILDEFNRFLSGITLSPPTLPIVSNLTGTLLTAAEAQSPAYWTRHLRQTVRFGAGLDVLLAEPNRVLLEVGPGQTLAGFARVHPRRQPNQAVIASMRHPKEAVSDFAVLQQAVARLWTVGVSINWRAGEASGSYQRLHLPTYPFERKHYAIEPPPRTITAAPPEAAGYQQVPSTTAAPPGQVMNHELPTSIASRASRADRICERLTEILQKLSGLALNEISPNASFLEMGFDSLFLTQASLRFKSEFKVKITFRQLFEEAPTLSTLADYIDRKLPAEAFPAPAPAAPVANAAPVLPSPQLLTPFVSQPDRPVPAQALPSDASVLERVVQEQLRIMAEQLRLLEGRPTSASPVYSPVEAVPLAHPTRQSPPPASSPVIQESSAPAHSAAPIHFGPFHGIDKAHEGLTPHQQQHLDALIERYTRRTQGSKQLTEAQRQRLADPRAVTGFRKTWKELVYQIATVRSEGSRVWDVDGNEYVDVTSSFGISLFGFSPKFVNDAIHEQLDEGIELGSLSPLAKEATDLICELTGSERVTFANTGSEAIAGAIRAVRTVTGREWIAVFNDEYHGIAEEVLVKSIGPEGRRRSAPAAPGIPDHMVDKVLVLHYDDPKCLDILRERAADLAGVIVEPVQNRHPGFRPTEMIKAVRAVTKELEIPLIFDEMITGFRLHQRGAQGYFGIDADLVCYGKIMSGGLPIAAIAGKAQYMDGFDGGLWRFGDDSYPEGGVTFFGGTFTRNPLSLAASVAALRHLKSQGPQLQQNLNARGDRLAAELKAIVARTGAPIDVEHCGSIFNLAYTTDNPTNRLFGYLLRERGLHIWDRPFFLTTAHSDADLAFIVKTFEQGIWDMQAAHFFAPPTTTTPPSPPGSSEHEGSFPLTEAQKEIWVAAHMDADSAVAYNETLAIHLRGDLDVSTLRAAISKVLRRHPILLARIDESGDTQHVSADVHLDLPLVDLSTEPDPGREQLSTAIAAASGTPFDLVKGPLVRFTIFRCSDSHHVVVWTSHHIVCDGSSTGVVLRDIAAAYSTLRAGMQWELPAAPAFRTFALESESNREESEEAMAYWQRQLSDLPPPLDLPTDRPRPAVRSAQASTVRHVMPATVREAVRRAAAKEQTTMVVFLITALKTLLWWLTGQSDVLVGMGAATQAATGRLGMVGHGVNMLPIRTQLLPEGSFSDNVKLLKSSVLDAFEHQQTTIGAILRCLRIPRRANRPTLIEVVFNLDHSQGGFAFEGLDCSVERVERQSLHYDIFVDAAEGPNGISIQCDYNTEIFDRSTIARWLTHYQNLLENVSSDPTGLVSAVPLLAPEEQRFLLENLNQTAVDYPLDRALHQFIEDQAARTPDAPALVFEGRTLTYGQFNARANQLAHRLRAIGVRPEVLVAVCAERSIEMVVALHAIVKAGGAYAPIDPFYPTERIALLLSDLAAPVALVQRRFADRLPADQARLILDDLDAIVSEEPESNLDCLNDPQSAAYVIYTSGSTGKPKGVVNVHEGIVNHQLWLQDVCKIGPGDRVLQKTPYTFDVSVWEFFLPFMTGACLVVAKPDGHKDPLYLARLIAEQQITTLHFVPSMLDVFLETVGNEDLSSVRRVICSGEALGQDIPRRFFERFGTSELHNLYGPTEAAIHVTSWQCQRHSVGSTVPIGRPIANTQIYILDGRMMPVPIGVAGELYIGGVGVARGYLRRPDLTAERFVPDPYSATGDGRLYRTGDSARILPDGAIEYLGRLDNQVKIRGLRIELGEIEAAIKEVAGVAQVAVTVREDKPGDRRLVAYLVAQDPSDGSLTDRVRDGIGRQLPDYMVPAAFVTLGDLPLTSSGKLNRQSLPAPSFEAVGLDSAAFIEPSPGIELQLAEIWRELLHVPRVGLTDNFFDLGGHSLLAMRLAHRVHRDLAVGMSPAMLFANPVLRDLARAIRALMPAVAESMSPSGQQVLVRLEEGGSGAPFFWVHGIGGEVFSYMQISKHIGGARPVYGFTADWSAMKNNGASTVEEMAACYVEELVKVYPSGPYYLGGFCSAALLAMEMSRQLEAAGRRVNLIVAIDFELTSTDGAVAPRGVVPFIRNLPYWIADDAAPSGVGVLMRRVQSRGRQLASRLRGAGKPEPVPTDLRDRLGMWRFPDYQLPMLELHHRALAQYRPSAVQSPVLLFLPRTAPLFGPWRRGAGYDPTWNSLAAGGLEVYQVKGSHATILTEPNAGALARIVEECISQTEQPQDDRAGITNPGRAHKLPAGARSA